MCIASYQQPQLLLSSPVIACFICPSNVNFFKAKCSRTCPSPALLSARTGLPTMLTSLHSRKFGCQQLTQLVASRKCAHCGKQPRSEERRVGEACVKYV